MQTNVCSRRSILSIVDALEPMSLDLGVRGWEMERLIGVHDGLWPMSPSVRALWWPTKAQSRRVEALGSVFAAALGLIGADAALWLRNRNVGLGCSPIRFMLSNPDGVAILRRILAAEQGAC